MSNEQKLLPCPFCGGKAYQGAHLGYYYINCADCGIDGPSGVNEQKAVEAWNTRTDTSQQQAGNDLSDLTFELMQLFIAEKNQRIKELKKALADATVQINQLMGEYDSEC